jgi:phosphate transport system substrate-binding protein
MKKNVMVSLASIVCILALGSCGNGTSSVSLSTATTSAASTATSTATSTAVTFDTTKNITVYTRDTTSGTRDGFFSKIGMPEAVTDSSKLAAGAVEVSSNGDMMQKIKNDKYGIGYISLSTLGESGLTGLKYANVIPNEANVLSGNYSLVRNFNYIIRNDFVADSAVGQIAKAFIAFMGTKEAKTTMIAANGILAIGNSDPTWASIKANYPIVAKDNSKVTVKFGGSTSVEEMSKALTDQFSPLCGNFVAAHNHLGSGDAYKHTQAAATKDDSGSLDVAFLSRELKLDAGEPAASGTYGKLCTDAIVAVVNSVNTYTSTDGATLCAIFKGTDTVWSEVIK